MTKIVWTKPPNRIVEWFRHLYIRIFCKCQKCGKAIYPNDGYWSFDIGYPVKNGHYHPQCATLGSDLYVVDANNEVNKFKLESDT